MFSFLSKASSAISQPQPTRDDISRDPWSAAAETEYEEVSFTNSPHLPSAPSTPASAAYPPSYGARNGSQSSSHYAPVKQSFATLYPHLEQAAPHILDSLADAAPFNSLQLASLEATLAPYRLPRAVKEAWLVHDGQLDSSSAGAVGENGSIGLFYGLKWMSIEQVEEEWRFWRALEAGGGSAGSDPFAATSNAVATGTTHIPNAANSDPPTPSETPQANIQGMRAFPEGWVRAVYSHPGWLPLLSDQCGNYIGVDLDPPPPPPAGQQVGSSAQAQQRFGQPGQVIAFGREIDEKVVLYPGDGEGGWGKFIAAFVDDVARGGAVAKLADADREQGTPVLGRGWDAEQGTPQSEEEEEVQWTAGDTDGLGDDYLGGGASGEDNAGRTWVLSKASSAWLNSQEGHAGIIGALAEQSRRRWRSMGVGGPAPPRQKQPAPRQPMRPELLVQTSSSSKRSTPEPIAEEDEPTSTTTERPPPRQAVDLLSGTPKLDGEEGFEQAAKSPPASPAAVIISPPSPEASRPPGGLPGPVRRTSPGLLDSRAPPRKAQNSSRSPPAARRKRAPPPPPAAIHLPTFDDLSLYPSDRSPSEQDPTLSPAPQVYVGLPLGRNSGSDSIINVREGAPRHTREFSASSGTGLVGGEDGEGIELSSVVVVGEDKKALAITTHDQPYVKV